MYTEEIPRQLWVSYLKGFSRVHLGQQVRLWVAGPRSELRKEAVNLPLVGIDVDRSAAGCERIDVIVGDAPGAHVTHDVRIPSAVRVAVDDAGEDMSLQIDSEDGSSTFVNLVTPAAKATPAAFA
jgi:hypothetical protein